MTTLSDLAEKGLVFQATFDVETLPTWVASPIRAADVDLRLFRRLVMLGQGGPVLWESIQSEGFRGHELFDDYATMLVDGFAESLGHPLCDIIYPSDVLLPLGRMAEYAGWGSASPLGLTVHHRYGPWLAHRIVFLIDAELPLTDRTPGPHPCATCADTPCVAACPVGAVSVEAGFDVDACAGFRIRDESPCADKCLARLACPIGTEHVYGEEQMTYHYRAGLDSIKRWFQES